MRRRRFASSFLTASAAAVVAGALWWSSALVPEGAERTVSGPAAEVPESTPSPEPPEPAALPWGPTEQDWQDALATARALDVETAAGQVLIAAVSDPEPDAASALVRRWNLGGVIVMGEAIDSARQVGDLTAAVADADDREWPVVISVDQEGGTVARLRGVVPDIPGFLAAGAARDKEAVRSAFADAGRSMSALGFTVDFAPVADVTIGLADPTIRSRSAGSDPSAVAATVTAATLGLLDGGVVPVIKHFPGHGSVTTDSHTGLPEQERSLQELEREDLVPFRRAIAEGAPAMMMGHIAVEEWGELPASLEPLAYEYVREALGFTGVIFTDAMNMGAIEDEEGSATVAALRAGADAVVIPRSVSDAHRAIVDAIESGALSRDRLDDAAARVILMARWQESLGDARDADPDHARSLAAAGVTVAAERCDAPFVGEEVTLSGGFERDREALARALARRGVAVGETGTRVTVIGADDGNAQSDVVVALGGPWGLSSSDANVYVGLYGRSADAFEALAAVLVGDAEPGGRWPVAVDVPHDVCGGA